ncbi:MAG: hypothetical protein WCT05_08215 [Lentisphaeria bacterium]
MRKFFLSILAATGFLCVLVNAADSENQLWAEEFQHSVEPDRSWRWYDISSEVVNHCLRVRETGKKSWGSFQKYVSFDLRENSEYRYLQVQAGAVEFTEMGGNVTNTSSGGRALGPVFPGWNTYDLRGQIAMLGKKGDFSLAFLHSGVNGTEPGGWSDYRQFRIVKVPYDGLTVTLYRGEQEFAGPGKIGDWLLFTYHSAVPLPEAEFELSCIAYPLMAAYHFSETGMKLRKKSPGVYIWEQKIDASAIKLDTVVDKQQLVACAKINDQFVYGTLAAALEIEGDKRFGYEGQIKGTPQTIKYRQLWMAASQGTNLALGKKVIFSRVPDYGLTRKGDSDAEDLTDGKLSNNQQDKIWFDSQAVGWINGAADGVNLLIDLGEKKAIDRVLLRCLGGAGSNLIFPKRLQLFLSQNGKDFYQAANLEKLMPGERSQSDFMKFFYLEEQDSAYVYPFSLSARAEARYVGLTVYGASDFLICDELAIMAASDSKSDPQFNHVYSQESQKFHTSGIVFGPRINCLPIITNADVPNKFFIQDLRKEEECTLPVKLFMELPEQLELLNDFEKETIAGINKYLLLEQKQGRLKKSIGSCFIRWLPKSQLADGTVLQASFYAEINGQKSIIKKLPIELRHLPEFTPYKRLHVSLSWMTENVALAWPDFYDNWRKLGFNTISLFPRYWGTATKPELQQWMDTGRQLGYKLIMNESPFHPMVKKQAPGSEVFSQLATGDGRHLCPSYRGKHFQQELQRVCNNVIKSRPDFVFWDIECWYNGAAEAAACSRCAAAWKKSNLSMNEYLNRLGTELNQALYDQVVKASLEKGFPMPLVASYDRHASSPNYALLENFFADYPKTLKLAQPSLYVGGRAEDVHDCIRAEYRLLKNRDILPWLSPGCYGEFEPEKMEVMVLEALLNGACGITYYSYAEFDNALDFYYHCKALAKLAPYEELLLDGEVLEPNGTNPDLYYSGIKKKNQMIFLVGNYRRADEQSTLQSPLTNITSIVDLESGEILADLNIKIPKGGFRLLYLEAKP